MVSRHETWIWKTKGLDTKMLCMGYLYSVVYEIKVGCGSVACRKVSKSTEQPRRPGNQRPVECGAGAALVARSRVTTSLAAERKQRTRGGDGELVGCTRDTDGSAVKNSLPASTFLSCVFLGVLLLQSDREDGRGRAVAHDESSFEASRLSANGGRSFFVVRRCDLTHQLVDPVLQALSESTP